MTTLKVGDPAPAFALLEQHGETVRIEDYRGARSSSCTSTRRRTRPGARSNRAICATTGRSSRGSGWTSWGSLPDDPKKQLAFDEKYHLGFPLLADEDHDGRHGVGNMGHRSIAAATRTWASCVPRSWWTKRGGSNRRGPRSPRRTRSRTRSPRSPRSARRGSVRVGWTSSTSRAATWPRIFHWFEEILGGHVVFAIDSMGTRVAAVELSDDPAARPAHGPPRGRSSDPRVSRPRSGRGARDPRGSGLAPGAPVRDPARADLLVR